MGAVMNEGNRTMTKHTNQAPDPLPRLTSNLTACVRWRRADLAEALRKQLRLLQAEQELLMPVRDPRLA